ncbi:winged helix-turn-helix transcriptional regulator [Clostridium perfringens]|uniref:Winged helix-turn-helix transcriptional regulator n=2 Tax=Eubacteriales TaxID=186802 RepID=A0ABD4PTK8_CLOPF|nr:winged helix family transcriptional regulator [Clostridium perfringens]EJA6698044.1 winged helix-turn-helix transcriptional regulator [Clostridioides difficile]MBS5311676.1 winged helix-turn-helix transcriptional regulator [Clostridiales bacterium]MCF0239217.1 winged helix-turn-helix transcriptional regulator [Streptococcus gallolyticus]OUQ03017.1 transcriptional regulator [Erysipelatoclostridium sp. An15]OUQ12161.1 transcriptional regulator [Massilimicrobiota sp. An142]RGD74289.1 winged h
MSLSDNEEEVFKKALEWLSNELVTSPIQLKQYTPEFSIDPYTRSYVKINGEEVYLTSKQFDLLFFLYRHKGQVFTKEQIYENVWGYDNAPDASNLSSFIRKLRLKIEPHPDNPQYIITVWGVGYKFSGEEKP